MTIRVRRKATTNNNNNNNIGAGDATTTKATKKATGKRSKRDDDEESRDTTKAQEKSAKKRVKLDSKTTPTLATSPEEEFKNDLSTVANSLHLMGTVPGTDLSYGGHRLAPKQTFHTQWKWDHVFDSLNAIQSKHPGSNIYIVLEQEGPEVGGTVVPMPVLHALIVPSKGTFPEFVRLKPCKTGTEYEDEEFVAFRDLSLSWERLGKINNKNNSDSKAGGLVFGLMYTGRKIRNVQSPDIEQKYGRAELVDFRPSKFPKYKTTADGSRQIQVDSAVFEFNIRRKHFRGAFVKGVVSKSDAVEEFIEENEEKGLNESHAAIVDQAIVDGFANKRDSIAKFADFLEQFHGADFLESVCVAKIYPSNMSKLVPDAAKEIMLCSKFRLALHREKQRLLSNDADKNDNDINEEDIAKNLDVEALFKAEEREALERPFKYTYPATTSFGKADDDMIFFGGARDELIMNK